MSLSATDRETGDAVDYATILRHKVAELRAEIARLRELNQAYRRHGRRDVASVEADLQRQARLDEIKKELARLADLGGSVSPGKRAEAPQMPFLVKRAS
jgi:hypothetical protein